MSEEQLSQKEEQIAQLTGLLKGQPVQQKEVPDEKRGTLEVQVIEAKLERSTEMFGKQDPFAEISIRLQKFKTKTHTDGAKAPVWKETTSLDVLDPTETMTVQVFDEDLTSNDIICEGTIDLASLCLSTPVDSWFDLQYNGKQSGSIHLKTTYTLHK